MDQPPPAPPTDERLQLLYYFCRMQLPAVALPPDKCARHLDRAFRLFQQKGGANGEAAAAWTAYLENFYPLDWFVASACLEGDARAWEHLFAARAGRADCLLLDALRARAVRLYPRDEERQESAVNEFWGHLFAPETAGSLPILARYDGQRPLVPWLIRVFQNWHVSQLRRRPGLQALPEDDLSPPLPASGDARWHDAFCLAAREALADLNETELLVLGLRLRYRMSQREVASLLGMHEGTVSRKTDQLRDRCLEHIGNRLQEQGWTGDELFDYVRTEMGSLLLDDPRLAADHLARLLAARGKQLPPA
jgi:RNA polymerase sigma factor (sigma-70 family)